ncbi:hypothetical protein [Enterococcus rivorum]|uniref:Uncharacterized protein n=1 Tax=Enterococcus rivorum TaxID=762845 RepID=A0A1E5KUV1_9ENTE|nr:hypothetical protein [Enterococcus rivorum]MBP2099094.1 hypothetical protein [Enterococcus rivorum]OEH81653.1 hypothetical protein BCR26_15925 [Enterococcus rivorum]
MTTIKVECERLAEKVAKVKTAANNYQDKVVSSSLAFMEVNEDLQGQGYDSLLSQISKRLEGQKKLVAECNVLTDAMKDYQQAMSEAESSANFPT